jgi:hypothetical protein
MLPNFAANVVETYLEPVLPDFIDTKYQNGKNIPNHHIIYQMATKYTEWP